ncbi:unnamed protein product [Rhizophagus irregularis]|nr:unnamed protein product [Rhizophagus irregularis]
MPKNKYQKICSKETFMDNPLGNLKIRISCQIRITGNPSNHPRIIRIILGYNRNIITCNPSISTKNIYTRRR